MKNDTEIKINNTDSNDEPKLLHAKYWQNDGDVTITVEGDEDGRWCDACITLTQQDILELANFLISSSVEIDMKTNGDFYEKLRQKRKTF